MSGLLTLWRGLPPWARWACLGLALLIAGVLAWRLGLGLRAFLAAALGLGGAGSAAARASTRARRQVDDLAADVREAAARDLDRDRQVDAELAALAQPDPVPDEINPDPAPERPRSRFLETLR